MLLQETEDNLKQQVQELKEEVWSMLTSPVEKPSQKLNLIDALQRLGVSYHFENEIEETLQQLHMTLHDSDDQENDDDLYIVALQFRLLRQQGYNISSGKFPLSPSFCCLWQWLLVLTVCTIMLPFIRTTRKKTCYSKYYFDNKRV